MSDYCVWNDNILCTEVDKLREFSRQIAEACATNDGRLWLEGVECPSDKNNCPKYLEYIKTPKQR